MKVCAVQMLATADKQTNLRHIAELVRRACENNPDLDLLCFPEYCYVIPGQSRELMEQAAEATDGRFATAISELARAYRVNIIPGTFVEREGANIYNTALAFSRTGEIIAAYRKIHLADTSGHRESAYMDAGDKPCVFDSDCARIGLATCYDIRFPELMRTLALQGAQVIVIPCYFPVGNPLPPRTQQFDICIAAAALHNSCHVVAVNQYGASMGEYPFGRSAIIDPWGVSICRAPDRPTLITATLDLDLNQQAQESIGTFANRRPEIYKLI